MSEAQRRQAPRFDPGRRRAVTLRPRALIQRHRRAGGHGGVDGHADDRGRPAGPLPLLLGLLDLPATSTVTMPLYGRWPTSTGGAGSCWWPRACSSPAPCARWPGRCQLIVARGLQGIGAEGLLPVAIAVVADLYAFRERARIQALFSAIWGTASLIGPLLGAFLTVTFGWRSIFLVVVPLALVSLALEATQMRESRASRPDPFDGVGGATLAAGVTAVLLATLHEAGGGGHVAMRLGLLVAGAGFLVVFARRQARRQHPLVPLSLLTHRDTASPYLAGASWARPSSGWTRSCRCSSRARAADGGRGGRGRHSDHVLLGPGLGFGTRALVRYGFRATARVGPSSSPSAAREGSGGGPGRAGVASAPPAPSSGWDWGRSRRRRCWPSAAAPEAERGVASSLVPSSGRSGSLGVGLWRGALGRAQPPPGDRADAAGRLIAATRAPCLRASRRSPSARHRGSLLGLRRDARALDRQRGRRRTLPGRADDRRSTPASSGLNARTGPFRKI